MTLDSVMRSEKKQSAKANTFYDYVNSHERSRRDKSVGEKGVISLELWVRVGVTGWWLKDAVSL